MVGLVDAQAEDKLSAEEEMLPLEAASVESPELIRPEEYVEAVVSSAVHAYEKLLEERQRELDRLRRLLLPAVY